MSGGIIRGSTCTPIAPAARGRVARTQTTSTLACRKASHSYARRYGRDLLDLLDDVGRLEADALLDAWARRPPHWRDATRRLTERTLVALAAGVIAARGDHRLRDRARWHHRRIQELAALDECAREATLDEAVRKGRASRARASERRVQAVTLGAERAHSRPLAPPLRRAN